MAREAGGPGEYLEGLRRRWPLVLLVGVPLFLAVFAYTENLPSTYRSTAVVSLTPRPDVVIGGDVLRVVAPKYVAYLASRPTTTSVARSVGIDPADLRGGLDVSVAPETANLEITVELGRPADAAAAAAQLSAEAVRLAGSDRLLAADLLVPAVAVEQPSGPRRRLIEAGGLLLALLAGVTVALVVDRSQPRVSTTDELASLSGLRTLVALPRSRRLRRAPREALDDPGVSAAVGTLLVQLDTESRIEPVKVVAVTSPLPGDGKTTVAAVLATGLARLDARVLLLDGDMRRPRLAQHMGVSDAGPVLTDVLEGTTPLDRAVVAHEPPSLHVLPTRGHPEAGNLLARRLKQVLEDAAERYDVVVLDCPPVLATDDALVITVMCDGVLLVVDRGGRASVVQAATSTLQGLKVRVVGTVLNRAKRGAGGSQAYGVYARR